MLQHTSIGISRKRRTNRELETYVLERVVVGAELLGHAQTGALQQRAQVRFHLQYLLQLQHLLACGGRTKKERGQCHYTGKVIKLKEGSKGNTKSSCNSHSPQRYGNIKHHTFGMHYANQLKTKTAQRLTQQRHNQRQPHHA